MTAPLRTTLAAAALLLAAGTARAAIEEGYDPMAAPVPSTWYAPVDPAAQQADRDYVAGMRPHHEGALSMSRDYLADPAASSPMLKALAAGIIRNQRFEIGLLDEVVRNLDAPPRVLNLGIARIALQPVATEGLGQVQRFLRSPSPGLLTAAAGPVTTRDVQFAKAMIIHHQAALEMARAYHANPAARNGFLGLLNTDIITDQSQEIALMRRVIAAYPGDAAAVPVDPGMIHGMEGMHHAPPAPQAAPPVAVPAAAPPPHRHPAPRPAAKAPAMGGHAGHAHGAPAAAQ
ncbi:DUF305 domain-containing protein [Roseicella aquatilis]|uniref:DUF305 domain-containing protein n=1 Tax=Roseicella aquatilis TaxID=2527868 RepID=A0A4R4DS25_9PROT|nr:DUF305 domain-containing protein [Roseicella aquatilis]TCZ64005.1 DUF305 domain-containing protein [Roseicella aquatilis]